MIDTDTALEPDFYMDDLLAEIGLDRKRIYKGPGAKTAPELQRADGIASRHSITRRAREAVEEGRLVEVYVLRQDRPGRIIEQLAWVKKDVYNAYMEAQNNDGQTDE